MIQNGTNRHETQNTHEQDDTVRYLGGLGGTLCFLLLIRVSLSDHGKVKVSLKVPPIVQYRPPRVLKCSLIIANPHIRVHFNLPEQYHWLFFYQELDIANSIW